MRAITLICLPSFFAFLFGKVGVFVNIFDLGFENDQGSAVQFLDLETFFIIPVEQTFQRVAAYQLQYQLRAVVHLLDVIVILGVSFVWRRWFVFVLLVRSLFYFSEVRFYQFSDH